MIIIYFIWLLYIIYDYYILYIYVYSYHMIDYDCVLCRFRLLDLFDHSSSRRFKGGEDVIQWIHGSQADPRYVGKLFWASLFFQENTEVWKHLLRDWICLVYNIHILFGILHGQGASWNLFQRPLLYLLWNSRCSLFWSDVIWMFATPYFKCPVIPVTYLAQDSRLKS